MAHWPAMKEQRHHNDAVIGGLRARMPTGRPDAEAIMEGQPSLSVMRSLRLTGSWMCHIVDSHIACTEQAVVSVVSGTHAPVTLSHRRWVTHPFRRTTCASRWLAEPSLHSLSIRIDYCCTHEEKRGYEGGQGGGVPSGVPHMTSHLPLREA